MSKKGESPRSGNWLKEKMGKLTKRRFSTAGVGLEAKQKAAMAILIPKNSSRGANKEEFLRTLQKELEPSKIHSTVKSCFSVRRRGEAERERLFVIDEGIILVTPKEDNIIYFHGFPFIQSFAEAENALSGYWLPFRGEKLNFVFRFADQGTAATFSMMCMDFATRWAEKHREKQLNTPAKEKRMEEAIEVTQQDPADAQEAPVSGESLEEFSASAEDKQEDKEQDKEEGKEEGKEEKQDEDAAGESPKEADKLDLVAAAGLKEQEGEQAASEDAPEKAASAGDDADAENRKESADDAEAEEGAGKEHDAAAADKAEKAGDVSEEVSTSVSNSTQEL